MADDSVIGVGASATKHDCSPHSVEVSDSLRVVWWMSFCAEMVFTGAEVACVASLLRRSGD